VRVCVFCGSSPGNDPAYLAAARETGRTLAERGIGLVYGGASVGTMGEVADAALAAGGEVFGVIPQSLVDREVAHHGLTELRVVTTLHERKAAMASLADGFVALPGGAGTLEELFEVWTWAQLGLHTKPVALLDVQGFYQPLLRFLDHAIEQGFLSKGYESSLIVESTVPAVLDRFADYTPPPPKWSRNSAR
jgi:uncharacterized protein (TIGR00730 family)